MRSDGLGRGIQIGRYKPSPTALNLSIASANVQLGPNKVYRLWPSVDAFFETGTSSGVTASTSSHPITAKLDYLHFTDDSNVWLAGIVSTGTGVLYISEVDVL